MESVRAEKKPNGFWEVAGLVAFFVLIGAGFASIGETWISGPLFGAAMVTGILVANGGVERTFQSAFQTVRPFLRVVRLVVLAFVVLWVLVAAVKWMWFHS